MRRLLTATGLLLLVAAALAGTAAAKDMSVSLAAGPPPLDPGEPWNARLLVHGEPDMLAEATPGITLRNERSGDSSTFPARPTGRRAADGQLVYRVRVVAPSEGTWRYSLVDGVTDREYAGGLLAVGQAANEPSAQAPTRAAPIAAAADDDPFLPGWALVAGAVGLALALAGVAVAVRHRRLQPST